MPQLRIARATSPTDPAESSYAVFASNDAERGDGRNWFIGRDRGCKVCIADASVSRQHLQVIFQGGSFHLRNVSQFGSEVDGKPLTNNDAPFTVRGNLSIKVGTIELRCTLIGESNGMLGPLEGGEPPAAGSAANGNLWWISPASSMDGVEMPAPHIVAPPTQRSPDDWHLGEMVSAHTSNSFVDGVEPWLMSRDADAPAVEQSFDWTTGLSSSAPVPSMVDVTPSSSRASGDAPVLQSADFAELSGLNGTKQGVDIDASPGESNSGTAASDIRKANPDDARLVVQQILHAAGLRGDVAQLYSKECSPEKVGAILSQLLTGLIAVLTTRQKVKNELRVAHTEVGIEGNNPLKRAVSASEALIGLVNAQRPGYLAAEQAIRGVFEDLSQHELAVLEGIEAALKQVIELVDPQVIERATPPGGMPLAFVAKGSRGGQSWTIYKSRFSDLLGDGRAFKNHFLPAFRDAYDACLAKLRRTSTKGGK